MRPLAVTAVAVAATLAASAPWARAYPPGRALPLLAAAAAGSVAVPALLGRVAGLRAWWSMAVSLAGLLALLVLTQGVPGSLAGISHGLSDGLARLLSESLPVSTPRWVLEPALVATWTTGAVCGELVARTRAAAGAAAVLVGAFVLAVAVTASAPGQPVGWALALVALVGALLALAPGRGDGDVVAAADAGDTRRRASAGPVAFGLASLVAGGAAGAFLVPALPGRRPVPASLARVAPVRPSEPLTPTATMVALRDEPVRPLFTVRLDAPADGYLEVAELDTYDGSRWSFDQLFVPSGGRIPPVPGTAGTPGASVVQRYHLLRSLPMPWMPFLDRPVEVDGVAVEAAAASGMVMPATPLAAGARLRVVSSVPPQRLATAGARALAAGPAPAASPEDLAVPPSEDRELAGFVAQLSATAHTPSASPLRFLRAAEADLAAHDRTIPPARGAHRRPAPADTTFADAVHAVVVARRATPEQYATFFALLARHLGVPARLVTGFRLPAAAAGRRARAGRTYTVTTADAWTWDELAVRGLGWLVADPTPGRAGAAPLPVARTGPRPTATTLPAARAVPRPAASGHALAPRVRVALGGPTGADDARLGALAGVGLLVSAWLVLLGARARRRRRRRQAGDPAARAAGAWLETLDTLEDAALGELGPLTAGEVVAAARARLGPAATPHLDEVAERANLALYSAAPGRLSDEDADRSWAQLDELRRAVRRALPWSLRLRAALALRRRPARAQLGGGSRRRRKRPTPRRGAAGASSSGASAGRPPRRRTVSSTSRRAGGAS